MKSKASALLFSPSVTLPRNCEQIFFLITLHIILLFCTSDSWEYVYLALNGTDITTNQNNFETIKKKWSFNFQVPHSYTVLESLLLTFSKFHKLLYCTRCSSVFIADFKQMAYIVLVSLLLTLGMLHILI